jgi:hypothetical protein
MSEANTRSAEIEDIEVGDFIRFCEYAYRGDYTVPACTAVQESIKEGGPPADFDTPQEEPIREEESFFPEPPPPPPVDEEDWGSFSVMKKKKGKKGTIPIKTLRTQFYERNYLPNGNSKATELGEPQSNSEVSQDFTPVFLAHARLYSYANMQLFEPLKLLTLHKLHRTLFDFKLYEKRVVDVIELAKYAYGNEVTPERSDDGTVDELRKLVVEYIACEVDTIGKSKDFSELMELGGEFVSDFWETIRKYVTVN